MRQTSSAPHLSDRVGPLRVAAWLFASYSLAAFGLAVGREVCLGLGHPLRAGAAIEWIGLCQSVALPALSLGIALTLASWRGPPRSALLGLAAAALALSAGARLLPVLLIAWGSPVGARDIELSRGSWTASMVLAAVAAVVLAVALCRMAVRQDGRLNAWTIALAVVGATNGLLALAVEHNGALRRQSLAPDLVRLGRVALTPAVALLAAIALFVVIRRRPSASESAQG